MTSTKSLTRLFNSITATNKEQAFGEPQKEGHNESFSYNECYKTSFFVKKKSYTEMWKEICEKMTTFAFGEDG